LRGLPKEKDKLADIARSVRRHWEQRGHIIEAVSRDGLVITARSRSDDFRLSLSWTSGDIPGLGVSSPCVWPKGTPEPIPSSDLDRLSESRQTPWRRADLDRIPMLPCFLPMAIDAVKRRGGFCIWLHGTRDRPHRLTSCCVPRAVSV